METETHENSGIQRLPRRAFLQYAGASVAGIALLAAGCKKDLAVKPHTTSGSGIDIGTGDLAILNYAYALEQLESAFYIMLLDNAYKGITASETLMFQDICEHELIHMQFFKQALGSNAIPDLTPDFSSIDFTSRTAVLGAAKAFEDTGVAAYDGVGYLITDPDYLTVAGKIVSVEARHAAYIRNLVQYGDYAGPDVVDANGLNNSLTIAQVLPIANTYLKTKVSASHFNYTA
jgi:ferritin-like protein